MGQKQCCWPEEVRSVEDTGQKTGASVWLPQCHPCSRQVLPPRVHGLLLEDHTVHLHPGLYDKPGLAECRLSSGLPGIIRVSSLPVQLSPLSGFVFSFGKGGDKPYPRSEIERTMRKLMWYLQLLPLHFSNSCACTSYAPSCILPLWSHKTVIRGWFTLCSIFTIHVPVFTEGSRRIRQKGNGGRKWPHHEEQWPLLIMENQ